jgi:RND family efflux transporter MFP subunit
LKRCNEGTWSTDPGAHDRTVLFGRSRFARRRTARIVALNTIAFVCFGIAGCSSFSSQQPSAAAAPPAAVGALTIAPQTVSIFREYVARTQAVYTVKVRSRVTGELVGYDFQGGQAVHKGRLLFTIDPTPYRIAVASAQANLSKARSDVAEAQAQLDKADKDVQRYEPLAKIHAIPQQDLADAQAAEQVRRAQLKQSQAEVGVQQALVNEAQLNLEHTRIYSPIDGVIGEREVDPGNLVSATSTTPLATLSSSNPMLVSFAVSDAEYLRYFTPKKDRLVHPDAVKYQLLLADGTKYPHPGVFLHVSRALNEKTDTLSVVLRFPNPNHVLRPGEYAQVRADLEQAPDTLLVPVVAVQTIQGTESVLLVDSSDRVVQRTITTSSRQGANYVVTSGLKPGDRVIVQGQQKVQPGDKVKPHTAALGEQ